jgi:hypothetical protein
MSLNHYVLPALIALTLSSCYGQKRSVRIKLSHYTPYCGGARPTQEIEEDAAKPKPYANRTIVLVKNAEIDSARTDGKGMLRTKLRSGEYRLMESWRYYHGTPDGSPMENYDRNCLKEEWEKEFATLKIAGSKQVFVRKYEITDFCDRQRPCILESALGPERE